MDDVNLLVIAVVSEISMVDARKFETMTDL